MPTRVSCGSFEFEFSGERERGGGREGRTESGASQSIEKTKNDEKSKTHVVDGRTVDFDITVSRRIRGDGLYREREREREKEERRRRRRESREEKIDDEHLMMTFFFLNGRETSFVSRFYVPRGARLAPSPKPTHVVQLLDGQSAQSLRLGVADLE